MKRLPEAEEIIMSIIWRTETELTMAEIREQAEAKYKKYGNLRRFLHFWQDSEISSIYICTIEADSVFMDH